MRVTHLSTHDLQGGAGRAAYRLHKGLISQGEESSFLAINKESSDPSVIRFEPPRDLWTRLRRTLKREILKETDKIVQSRPAGSNLFTDDRSQHSTDVLRQLPASEVLNLHWVAGAFDYVPFFREVPKALPIVWTLHDMNPITGGCHHSAECLGFHDNCGRCPQIISNDQEDLSRQIWNRKHRSYNFLSKGSLCFVAPSRWLASKVRESSLANGFALSVIPYGLDTEVFQPLDKFSVRDALGVPREAAVILFVSYFAGDNYKGFPFLVEALKRICHISQLCLVSVGEGRVGTYQTLGVPILSVGLVREEQRMAQIYSCADLLILPSLQDNFPNTALEALACGLPVVAFDVGGVPEIVRNDCTGLVVPAANAEALATGIENLLKDTARRTALSLNCRRIAVEEYNLHVQARRYVELYNSLLQLKERM